MIRNTVGGEVKLITVTQLLSNFSPDAQDEIVEKLNWPHVSGVMLYEHLDLGLIARHGPSPVAMVFGPGCTYKTAEEAAAGHLGVTLAQMKYPVAYAVKHESPVRATDGD